MAYDKENEISTPPASGVALPVVLTVAELARVMRLDRKTIYELIAGGMLPSAERQLHLPMDDSYIAPS